MGASGTAVNLDTLTGGRGTNILDLTTAGTVDLSGISKFGTVNLAPGTNTVEMGASTLSGGAVTVKAAASGNNSINSQGDTTASTGKTLTYVAGVGFDTFLGGFEKDVVKITAAAIRGDFLTGGGAANTINFTTTGTVNLGKIRGFGTYVLANGAGNFLALATANFNGVTGGNGADTLSEAGVSATDKAVLKGGAGNDTLVAGRNAALTGGTGKDVFELTVPGSPANLDRDTIADFSHGTDKLALSEKGFTLGSAPVAASLFTTGSFTNASRRFAYDRTNGDLFYDGRGNAAGSTRLEIATLTNRSMLTASDITFVA